MNTPNDQTARPREYAGRRTTSTRSSTGRRTASTRSSADSRTASTPSESLEPRLRRLSRRGFAWRGAAALTGFAGWRWLVTRTQEDEVCPGRSAGFWRSTSTWLGRRSARRACRPNSLVSAARMPRVNGRIGIDSGDRPYRLEAPCRRCRRRRAVFLARRDQGATACRDDDRAEAASRAGARSCAGRARVWQTSRHSPAWHAERVGPARILRDLLGYVALETPTRYYVGLDMASALHPQTLLCYEMDGRPLTPDPRAPLRLVIPVKYGIKSLKQIGTIRFTDVGRPTTGPNAAMTGTRDIELRLIVNNQSRRTTSGIWFPRFIGDFL